MLFGSDNLNLQLSINNVFSKRLQPLRKTKTRGRLKKKTGKGETKKKEILQRDALRDLVPFVQFK